AAPVTPDPGAYAAPAGPSYAYPAPAESAPAVIPPPPAPPATRKRPKRLLIIVGVVVLAVAIIVSGFATSWFGLAGGGSRTPEAEAQKIAAKAEKLVNSFNAKNLFRNPLAALADISKEFAPSEARLASSLSMPNLLDDLAITKDTLSLVGDLAGAFNLKTEGIGVNTYSITDDIVYARFNAGTITVSADTAKLRRALEALPDTLNSQVVATARAYGLDLGDVNVMGSLTRDDNWVDDAVNYVTDYFPVTVNLGDKWANWQDCIRSNMVNGDWGCYDSSFRSMSAIVLVREEGRWYVSSMMTEALISQGGLGYDVYDSQKDWIREYWSDLTAVNKQYPSYNDFSKDWIEFYAEGKAELTLNPAKNGSPVDATKNLADALANGEDRGILRQLPLAERRYFALAGFGSLSRANVSGTRDDRPQFSDISTKGDHATVRIDDMWIQAGYGVDIGITDGTCFQDSYDSYCLKDFLDTNASDRFRDAVYPDDPLWYDLGVDPYALLDKIDLALSTMADSLNPDAMGLLTVKENGSWYVTVTGTAAQLENQFLSALSDGLKAARK
ncbi:MAG: hypothetical protein LBI33_10130, partial [Propionibacteriaceae bacterium]|nr:hypothetical protein [Propionibacteriaceae bacterium]